MARDVRDTARHAQFTRRSAILSLGAMGLFTTIFGRLYTLQVQQAEEFGILAEENRVNVRLLVPLRGRILDRYGQELATNRQNFRILLVPEDARNQGLSNVEDALGVLGQIVDLPDFSRARVLREAARNRSFVPITVKEDLTWEEFARVNVNLPDLPGIVPDVGQTRFYPQGEHVSHLVGHVGRVTEEEQALDDDPLLRLPDFRIGKLGIERSHEDHLRGQAGTSQVEVNAVGRVIRELQRYDGEAGDDVVLTIDEDVQRFAAQQFEGESGGAALIDVTNGDVLALVSEPGFDPNLFTFGISHDDWAQLRDNELNPMVNKAMSGQYPPGSTFKMLVALAALDAGVMSPSESVYCHGFTTLGNRDFHCWRRGGHGSLNMRNAIKQSCDVYFYEAARRLGIDRIADVSRRFGLGDVTGIPLPGERPGLVPTSAWKRATFGEPWQQGESLIAGIGQGFLLTTPVQLGLMTARLATGNAVVPRLVRPAGEAPQLAPGGTSMGFDPGHLALVQEAMNAVVNEAGGTARRSALTGEGLSMAGKTGTAQVRNISRAERLSGVIRNEDLPWRLRDHALFVGYGPVEAPRFAVSVVVEHGGGGSRAAAPRAREIMQYAQAKFLALAPQPEAQIVPVIPEDPVDG